jgi:hypothetical protein
VAVELAAGDEIGERQLVDGRRALVDGLLRGRQARRQIPRRDQPAQPEPRREDLARRAGVDDTVRAEPLERSDRLAVVAVLGVVVILDDEGVVVVGPGQEGGRRSGERTRPVGY